ncbi:MAG: hypothetical protein KDD47_19650 [Acidobacteria bacterium]|nr:hypothetical protein [Acidobacteriota bacterium]
MLPRALPFLFLLPLFWTGLPDPLEAQARPSDDFLTAVEGHPLVVQESELTSNDSGVWGTHLELVSGPSHGDLRLSGEPGNLVLTYLADWGPSSGALPPPNRQDSFSYILAGSAWSSEPATVRIQVSPARVPLAGRWKTPTCSPASCDDPGTDELGWFDAQAAKLHLCDLQCIPRCFGVGCHLESCRVFAAGLEHRGSQPVVGDWDGDGWEEVGFYDPASGALDLFALQEDAGDAGLGFLLPLERRILPSRSTALAGRWSSAAASTLGTFAPATGKFSLESFPEELSIEPPTMVRLLALVGDWDDSGLEAPALYDLDQGTLTRFGTDGGAQTWSWGFPASSEPPAWVFHGQFLGWPFVGLQGYGEDFVLAVQPLDGDRRGSLYILIPEDPNHCD